MQEVADHVEDRAVQHDEARLDGLVADGLGQMALADAGRSEQEHVAGLADEAAGGQVEDLLLLDRRVERPVEVVQRLQLAEAGGLDAAVAGAGRCGPPVRPGGAVPGTRRGSGCGRRPPAAARPGTVEQAGQPQLLEGDLASDSFIVRWSPRCVGQKAS